MVRIRQLLDVSPPVKDAPKRCGMLWGLLVRINRTALFDQDLELPLENLL
jgi:hypothetical protein